MSDLEFTTIDRVLAKIYREIKTDVNESDVIEWIGEALDFLRVFPVMEQAVTFLEVQNYETALPNCLRMIYQVARNVNWSSTEEALEEAEEAAESSETTTDNCTTEEEGVPLSCQSELLGDYGYAYYRPIFDVVWEYELWRENTWYQRNFVPVRLSNNTFFNTVVQDEDDRYKYLYKEIWDEYTIVGTVERKLRFSFKEGYVALSYLRDRVDPETGYPYIPSNISYITAITYFIKWKLAEWYEWIGRQGASNLEDKARQKWLTYARQAKNYAKMPKTIDDYYDHLKQSHQIVPLLNRYENYFRQPLDARTEQK